MRLATYWHTLTYAKNHHAVFEHIGSIQECHVTEIEVLKIEWVFLKAHVIHVANHIHSTIAMLFEEVLCRLDSFVNSIFKIVTKQVPVRSSLQ